MKDEGQSNILEHTAVVEREKVLNGNNRDLFLKKAPGICLLYLRLASGSAQERRAFITNQSMFQSTAGLTFLLYHELYQKKSLLFIEWLVILSIMETKNQSILPLITSEPRWLLKIPIPQLIELLQAIRLHGVKKIVIRQKQRFRGEATPRGVLIKKSTSFIARVS